MRKLLVLLVIAGMLVGGDAWIRATAERRVATELGESLQGGEPITVSFGGFPFTLRLLSGTIPSAKVSGGAVQRGDVHLQDLEMVLEDLSFDPSDALAGRLDSIAVRDGRGRAVVGQASLREAFRDLPRDVRLTIGRRGLRASVGPVAGAARLRLEGSHLVLVLVATEESVKVALPAVLDGVTYDSVRVAREGIVLEFSLTGARLRRL